MVLIMAPRSMHDMEYLGLPSARARLLRPLVTMRSGIPNAVILV